MTPCTHVWEPLEGEFDRYRCSVPGCGASGYKAQGLNHPQRGQIVAHKADDSKQRYARPEVTRKRPGGPSSQVQGGRRLGTWGHRR